MARKEENPSPTVAEIIEIFHEKDVPYKLTRRGIAINCPAEKHPGDGDSMSCEIRDSTRPEDWLSCVCRSHSCDYGAIKDGLRKLLELPSGLSITRARNKQRRRERGQEKARAAIAAMSTFAALEYGTGRDRKEYNKDDLVHQTPLGVYDQRLTEIDTAERTLRRWWDHLLLVRRRKKDGGDEFIPYVLLPRSGLWENSPAKVNALVVETETAYRGWWYGFVHEGKGALAEEEKVKKIDQWTTVAVGRLNTLDHIRELMSTAYFRMVEHPPPQSSPPEVLVCDEEHLDKHLNMLGTPSGVLKFSSDGGLDEPVTLPPEEGARYLITKSLPDPYDSKAEHPLVDTLFDADRWDPDHLAMLKSSLGFALRGNPSRRFLFVHGEGKAGKTTLVDCLLTALGKDYAGGFSAAALRRDRGGVSAGKAETEKMAFVDGTRLAFNSEFDTKQEVDVNKLKGLSGGGSMAFREMYRPERDYLVTATMVLVGNHWPRLGLVDSAVLDRFVPIEFPGAVEVEQADIAETFKKSRAARQALVKDLVLEAGNEAVRPRLHPATKRRREALLAEELGDIGATLLECVRKGTAEDLLYRDAVWALLARRHGEPDDRGRILNTTKQGATELLKRLVRGIDTAEQFRTTENGKTRRGWVGFKIVDNHEYETDPETEGELPF